MIKEGIHAFTNKRVLLLQGPLGPFFRRLARDLESAGAKVFKVNFNGGDWFFYPSRAINYRGSLNEWPAFFDRILGELNVDIVLLFGDCRPLHKAAHEIANHHDVEIGVFEEGYIRPDYITLERFGVNSHSLIPRNPDFYRNTVRLAKIQPTKQVGNFFWYATFWAILYYLAAIILWPFFRNYTHHRPLSFSEVYPWVKSVWRKGYYALKERDISDLLTGPLSKKYFLVPLQVHYDAQIHTHSNFDSVSNFISGVIDSFVRHAPSDAVLVFKHHPMDRGYINYTKLINSKISENNLQDRCFYIHDQYLPDLLKNARGVVVVNSTVGLSALYHGAPVKVCGLAIYDIEGLTFKGPLDRFWREAPQSIPDYKLFERFKNYLIQQTQLNGSFYKRLPVSDMATGVHWSWNGSTIFNKHIENLSNKTAVHRNEPGISSGESMSAGGLKVKY